MEMLIAVGVLVLGVVWNAAVRARTARRLRKAESLRDDRACWVCGSEDLQRLAEGAYRCRSCDGLQGFLAHKHRDAARVAGYARLTPGTRLALAAEQLSAARLESIAVAGELDHVLELSHNDRANVGDGGEQKLSRFANALLAVTRLEQKLVEGALLLASPEQIERLSVDLGTARVILDQLDVRVFWNLGDNVGSASGFGEGRTHAEIERAREHVAELERTRERLAGKLAAAQETAPKERYR